MSKVVVAGQEVDFDGAVILMDDEIRESLNEGQKWESDQAFVDAYSAAHQAKYGESFVVN